MAAIRERNGSYQIRVSSGYYINGKQITKTISWTPSEGMTKKQIEKELQRQATLFEEKVKQGYVMDERQKFAQYAEYVARLKERTGCKHRTVERYGELLIESSLQ